MLSHDTFTLPELEQKLVYYYVTLREIGPEPLNDAFNLTISDGQILINSKLIPHIYVQVGHMVGRSHIYV